MFVSNELKEILLDDWDFVIHQNKVDLVTLILFYFILFFALVA